MPTSRYSNHDIGLVMSATSPMSLFGTNAKRAKIRYHRIARSVHPDNNGNSRESQEAMAKLNSLWDSYSASMDGSRKATGAKRPTEVTRGERYAVFDEEERWIVIDRKHGGEVDGKLSSLHHLSKLLKGTPVCMLRPVGRKLIAQPDGAHLSFECEVPDVVSSGRKAIMLQSLKDALPHGKLHPADLAWITKRVLFLSGALCVCGLKFKSSSVGCLAIAPETHMLVVVAPWELEASDIALSSAYTRGIVAAFWNVANQMIDSDEKSRRIEMFLLGTICDKVTGWHELIDEFDELLFELFGKPKFHEMELNA